MVQQGEGKLHKDGGEWKRLEESNRHSNYRGRNEGLTTKKQSKGGEQKHDEGRRRNTVRHSSLLSRWINYAAQITEEEICALG